MMANSDEYTGGDVLCVGDGAGLRISSVGRATLSTKFKSLCLTNILHVPKLSLPLLSVHRFTTENDVFFEFHKSFFVVKDYTTKAVLLTHLHLLNLLNRSNP